MSKKIDLFPKIDRPGEYVAFVTFSVPTLDGPAYIYLGCDGYSEFAFQISVEPNESAESVIKAVYLLTENKDFARHINKGFTLVFERFEELSERIEAVVKPVNGKILFNKRFHQKIAEPLVSSFAQFGNKNPKG